MACDLVWNPQNSDNSLSMFLDSFERKTPDNATHLNGNYQSRIQGDFSALSTTMKSTNPFLTPSVFDENIQDSHTFFENVLNAGHDLISFEENCDPATKNTNPFLEPYLTSDIESNNIDIRCKETPANSFNKVDVFQDSSKSYDDFVDSSLDKDNECQIINYFDCKEWKVGEVITLRVSNIYHPHRFWIVPRYRELEIFMEYLCDYYSKNKESLRIKQVSVNLYCVVSQNNLFYRAIIVSFIPNDPHRVKVFAFDYGTILIVFRDEVYFLLEKLYSVPQFAVRSSLAYICPRDYPVWTSEAVKQFDHFSTHKVLLGQITSVHKQMRMLELNIGDSPTGGFEVLYINELLIDEGYAKYIFDKKDPDKKDNFKSDLRHLYLHPTFHMIETGEVPPNMYHFESLQSTLAFNVVYDQYCTI